MQPVGFIGLGRMGKNMVLHLLEQGVDVVVYNRTKEVTEEFIANSSEFIEKAKGKLAATYSIEEFVKSLPAPRIIWLMVPNGAPIDEVLGQLMASGMQKGDIVIDGGNTFYKDTVRRSSELGQKGITFLDCGTSGGLEGARTGACLMIGGDEPTVKALDWLWKAAATDSGYAYFGPSGAGHFVKMVHNGVEYGMNQALGEGFAILAKGPYHIDLAKVAHNWSHGSVVRGWLVDLLAKALDSDSRLDSFEGKVGGGQTGRWAIEAAKEVGVEAEILEESLEARQKSQVAPTFAGKVVSALRKGYGGHEEAEPQSK